MAKRLFTKNPFMSAWLSAANSVAGRSKAVILQQNAKLAEETTQLWMQSVFGWNAKKRKK